MHLHVCVHVFAYVSPTNDLPTGARGRHGSRECVELLRAEDGAGRVVDGLKETWQRLLGRQRLQVGVKH